MSKTLPSLRRRFDIQALEARLALDAGSGEAIDDAAGECANDKSTADVAAEESGESSDGSGDSSNDADGDGGEAYDDSEGGDETALDDLIFTCEILEFGGEGEGVEAAEESAGNGEASDDGESSDGENESDDSLAYELYFVDESGATDGEVADGEASDGDGQSGEDVVEGDAGNNATPAESDAATEEEPSEVEYVDLIYYTLDADTGEESGATGEEVGGESESGADGESDGEIVDETTYDDSASSEASEPGEEPSPDDGGDGGDVVEATGEDAGEIQTMGPTDSSETPEDDGGAGLPAAPNTPAPTQNDASAIPLPVVTTASPAPRFFARHLAAPHVVARIHAYRATMLSLTRVEPANSPAPIRPTPQAISGVSFAAALDTLLASPRASLLRRW